jgi:FkbM family methyltransferase
MARDARRLVRRLHLHRIAPAWKRSRQIAPSPAALATIWWTLALGFLERYVGALRSDRQRSVTVTGPCGIRRLYLRANAWDTFTFYEVFLKQVYRAALPLPPAATVVDLGGNIGLASAYFSMHSNDCHLVVVEPDAANCTMIKRNLDGLQPQVVQAAVDATSGTALLSIGASVRHHLARGDETPDVVLREVLTVALDELLASENGRQIDVLKVDIEGAEKGVFADAPRSLERVQLVIMEIHEADSVAAIEHTLGSAGLRHQPRPSGASQLDVPDVFVRVGRSGA